MLRQVDDAQRSKKVLGVAKGEWLVRVMMVGGLPMLADGGCARKGAEMVARDHDEEDHADHPCRAG
jgi:hypothetical protein